MTESTFGPGTILCDRYELTEVVGRGGFGHVYKARQLNMDRDVAIKVLPREFMSITDVVERFKREAKLASRLRHPNTITLHDYGAHEDSLFIVMELLTGEDLADILKREGRLPLERILQIATGILKSLSEAHRHGIVHRDLKPENIFLSEVGDDHDHVKVLDFGIAKLAVPEVDQSGNKGRQLTLAGSTVGTPVYMSPEQAAGENVDAQTDLYALGIMMYEMACGRPPFHDDDAVKVMRAHLFEPVPPLKIESLRNTLFDRVIQKALQKERENRFKSASEFLLALAGEAVARPVVAGVSPDFSSRTSDSTPSDFKSSGTLAFAKSANKQWEDQSDEVPFGELAEKPKQKERVTESSGLSDVSDTADAPPGFRRDRDANTSSIIRVIEPTPEPTEDEPVILLTKRKTPTANAEIDVASTSSSTETPTTEEILAVTDVVGPPMVGSSSESDEWSFDSEINPRITQRTSATKWFAVLFLLVGLAAVAWATQEYWLP